MMSEFLFKACPPLYSLQKDDLSSSGSIKVPAEPGVWSSGVYS